ncbi:MAG: ABC transporter substrate-binding protein [Gammaproteobacteria bacterium]|nr:ABC transporter substrate-binding protein [Gammaproteobacteria bacterium]
MHKFFIGLYFFVFLGGSHAEQIIIAVSVTPLSAPVVIAYEQGYFSEQGLNIHLQEYLGGMRTAQALFKGKAHFATSSEAVVMFNSFERSDFVVIGTFVESDNDVKILTTDKTAIHTVKDLSGHRVGTIIGTSAHFFIDHTLLMNGVDTETVEIVKINPEDTSKYLLSGEVDAVASWEPFIFHGQTELGKSAVLVQHDNMYTETFNLIVMKEFARQNPRLLEKLLTALLQANRYINKNKDRAQKMVAKRFSKDLQVIQSTWKDFNFSLSLHQSLLTALESQGRWALERGFVKGDRVPNYLNYLMIEPLEKIDSSAVTVIR